MSPRKCLTVNINIPAHWDSSQDPLIEFEMALQRWVDSYWSQEPPGTAVVLDTRVVEVKT